MRPSLRTLIVVTCAFAALSHPVRVGSAEGIDPVPLPWSPTDIQAGSEFGFSVATAGDVDGDGYNDLLVGAPGYDGAQVDEGRVYLFRGSKDGAFATAAWEWSSGVASARLGACVAPAGDVNGDGYHDVIVGAPRHDFGGVTDAGAAYLFLGGESGLELAPFRTYVGGDDEEYLGHSVATAGDVNGDGYADVLIGSPGYRQANPVRGRFWVDHGGAAGPDGVANREVVGDQDTDLGFSLAGAGDVNADGYADVVIGIPNADVNGTSSGEVRVYLGSAGGVVVPAWGSYPGGDAGDVLGTSVAGVGDLDGDGESEIIAGAPGRRQIFGFGVAYVLQRGDAGLGVNRLLGGAEGQGFATAVATGGDLDGDGRAEYLVAAPGTPGVGGVAGRVSVGRVAPSAATSFSIVAPVGAVDFASAVATGGDLDGDGRAELLVGDPAAPGGGAVFIYRGVSRRLISRPIRQPQEAQPYELAGHSVAIVPGFVEENRYPSVLFGTPHETPPAAPAQAGSVRSEILSPTGSTYDPLGWILAGPDADSRFGWAMVSLGDVDRDGEMDFAVGAPGSEVAGLGTAGAVFVYSEHIQGPVVVDLLESDQAESDFGSTLAGRGDFNGDGFHDLLVGAPGWDSGLHQDCGRVFLYLGGPGGLTLGWARSGTSAGQRLGAAVAWVGDLDGDAFTDFAVGSVSASPTGPPGKVDVHYGASVIPPVDALPAWTLTGYGSPRTFGAAIAGVGDVDGDEVSDMAVGAPEDGGVGRVSIYAGQRGRARPPGPIWTRAGTDPHGWFGYAIAGGGDLTGDGRADFVIGAPRGDFFSVRDGRAYVFAGGAPDIAKVPVDTLAQDDWGNSFGWAISNLSDLNSDGMADVVVSAPASPVDSLLPEIFAFESAGSYNQGVLWLTEPGSPTSLRPRPALTGSTTGFGARFRMRAAEGRARIRPELELELLGTAFDGAGLVTPLPAALTGPEGWSETDFQLGGLTPGAAYVVRARMTSRSPFFPRSRWIRPDGHASGEHDIRLSGNVVAVEPPADASGLAPRAQLLAARPSPAGPASPTRLDFALARAGYARLDVYDARGRHVRVLRAGTVAAGPGSASWDGADEAGRAVPAGVYFAVLHSADGEDRLRFVRVR